MQISVKFYAFLGLVILTGCRPGDFAADAKPISVGIFEVVDCKTGGRTPMSLKGSDEKYCLAEKEIVNETDVRLAHADRDASGRSILRLFFTIKTGQRIKDLTEHIHTDHLRHNGQAKLGLVIDGKLITVAALSGPLSDTIEVTGFTSDEALQVAQSLNVSRPPASSSSSNKQQ